MATQSEWYNKILSQLPSWFYTDRLPARAVLQALAKLAEQVEDSSDDLIVQTFLLTATGGFLDLHGAERSVYRYEGESDDSYRERIRAIDFSSAYPNLKDLVEAVINNGEVLIIENLAYGFAGVDIFADCEDARYLSKRKQYNRFTIIVPPQEVVDDSEIKVNIVSVVDENKAVGVFYDVYYGGVV